jgi:hypothetical protein
MTEYEGYHDESWVCELSEEDSTRLNVQFVSIVSSPAVATIGNAASGQSVLIMSEAIVDTETAEMYVPEGAHVEVRNISRNRGRALAELPSTTGTLKVLVIRVTDKNNKSPTANDAQLIDDIFTDSSSLATQTMACSYGALEIVPFEGKSPNNYDIQNGIINVKVDRYDSNQGMLLDLAALGAARALIGDYNHPMFDLIMMVLPKSDSSKVAWSFADSKFSFYHNDWARRVSAQMHEVGHNLGLSHSGHLDDEYGDQTGFMGYANGEDDELMCYNQQNNYQLGWYQDKTERINPVDGSGPFDLILNGVSDYDRINDAVVVLHLDQIDQDEDYFVGFNRATGINADTREEKNKVTIVRNEKKESNDYGKSTRIASLDAGHEYVFENFNGVSDVTIKVIQIENGDVTIRVGLSTDLDAVAPSPDPSTAPSATPTAAPDDPKTDLVTDTRCENNPDPFKKGKTMSTCEEVSLVNPFSKRCQHQTHKDNCPGLCDTKCYCVDNPYPFRKGKGQFTCAEVSLIAFGSRCKHKTHSKNCPGLCDNAQCPCADNPFPFRVKVADPLFSCDELATLSEAALTKKCRNGNVAASCLGLCNPDQCLI